MSEPRITTETDACRCIGDNVVTVRDKDTGAPVEYVRERGIFGWLRSGWREVKCPIHSVMGEPVVVIDTIEVKRDVGVYEPWYKRATLQLMSDGTVRWDIDKGVVTD